MYKIATKMLGLSSLLVGWGTVSDMESSTGAMTIDVAIYEKLTVLDFQNSAPTKQADLEKIAGHNGKVDIAGR
jgi:hypothetical protein